MASVYGKTYIKPHESFLNMEGAAVNLAGAAADVTAWRMPATIAIQGFSLVVTTTINGAANAPVLALDWAPETGVGRAEIVRITIPHGTLAGSVIQRLLQAPVTVPYGSALILEHVTAATIAGGAKLMPLLRSLGTA